jgi:predicted DNA-binding WGR domain protein
MKQCHLYYRRGTSDKIYIIEVVKIKDGYYVQSSWGRRGTASLTSRLSENFVMQASANWHFDKVKKEKLAKGYQTTAPTMYEKVDVPMVNMPLEFQTLPKEEEEPIRRIKL